MLIVDYVTSHYAVTHPLETGSEYQVLRSCRVLEAWLLRENIEATIDAPNELLLSRWVKWLELLYAPRTANRMRGDVMGVLNDAADNDPPMRAPIRQRRVRRPVVPPPNPKAWTPDTAVQLISGCRKLSGKIGTGVRKAVYMETIYRCAWCVALRRGDWWHRFRFENMMPDGRVWILQNKTKIFVKGRLGQGEVDLLKSIGYDLPLRWPHAHSTFYDLSWEVKKMAGITDPGHLQRFRKSAATDVARRHGRKAATEFLGHTNPRADAFYIDESMLDEPSVTPTELDLPPYP